MAEQTAKFRFKKYLIKKSSIDFSATETIHNIDGVSVDVKRNNLVSEKDNVFKLDMFVGIQDKDAVIKIEVLIQGEFEFDSDLNEDQKKTFFEINAPAILFPYVRAYIASLTALSGFMPLNLPTINFAARNQ